MAGNRRQHRRVIGIAEELIERLLRLCERGTQLVHHTAHGLVVADPAVQLLHPLLQRFGLCASADRIKTFGQTRSTRLHLVAVCIQLFKGCLQVQNRGCHFHGQRGGGRLSRARGGVECTRQCLGQAFTARVELAQRIADQAELIRGRLELVAISPCQSRPRFRGCSNPLARLRQ